MQCENCSQRPASVHQTVIVNGQKQESHLCEVCAQEKGALGGMMASGAFSFPNLSIAQLLSSFLGKEMPTSPTMPARQRTEPSCRHCGMTYSQFADSGRLGCSQCYDDLEPYLTPLIKRIHGTTGHTGKAPKRTGGIVRRKRELEALRQQLVQAVAQEQYEEAARLRDVVKRMESQIQAGGDGGDVE